MKDEELYNVLIGNQKQNEQGELIVILFEFCNLSCQACYQDHSSMAGVDSVQEKFDIIAHALDVLKGRGKTSVAVNIMGGELFADELPDTIFDDYTILVNRLRDYSEKINLPSKFSVPSNMIWTKKDRVKKFLNDAMVRLNASYDPAGRFNPKTLSMFIDNVKEFKPYINQIGIVMTRPSIKKFMNYSANHFDFLYENFEINFDHYTHSQRASVDPELLMPKDTELRDFYKFMIDHYPNCYPFCETMDSGSQPMFCMRTMYVFPDSTFGSCGSVEKLINPLSKIEDKKVIRIINTTDSPLEKTIEAKWYKEYDCLNCDHLQRCSMSCFLNNHFYNTRTQEECWLKEVYQYVDSKK